MSNAIERAAIEEAAGRPWRAKEILRGNVGGRAHDSQLYLAYGELLLRLGEQVEAGKYLLLAGSRNSAHEEAIGLFLGRHGGSPRDLFFQFPVQARRLGLDAYPTRVRDLLSGFEIPVRKRPPRAAPLSLRSQVRDVAGLVACATIVCVVIAAVVAGIYALVQLP